MENKKTRVSVFVAGQRFNILTDKSEKYVLDIASEIDARINSLVVSQDMTRERAAVLTALDYADDSELDKENIAAVKEQIKDYLHEIERLQDNNAKLISDYNLLKAEYERLIEEKQSAEEAKRELGESRDTIASLQGEVADLKEQLRQAESRIEEFRRQAEAETIPDINEAPLPLDATAEEERIITPEDDLFFEPEEEKEQIKPEKKKKNRHDHNHVNPYRQKAQEKAQKGYQQQRQYSIFDLNEE